MVWSARQFDSSPIQVALTLNASSRGINLQILEDPDGFLDPAVIDGGRDGLITDLTANKIGSSVHFIPLHHHPAYRDEGAEFALLLPETEKYYSQAVSLPLLPGMSDSDVEDVIEVVAGSVKRRTR